jgi:hypothetical protein
MTSKPWTVRTVSGFAGGEGDRSPATLTLEIKTESNTVEEVRELVERLPEFQVFANDMVGYLEMKLVGFRQDYPEGHCMVQTALVYLAQARAFCR